ncbi:uncharacterized protein C8R40DRAFT_131073 [Lentinula edodes]|uniref:uncharacterized protein n=1 Tax=Lentinula edodes TaxID=5353 RepID=UPI001E8DE64F|nr:uncharacterized protein C8R40DRAFT_131073 [Lentinula edodes]KAH7876375.1 hypothetical protein C8R40DRAFT_131073 [Lentinula edodes]
MPVATSTMVNTSSSLVCSPSAVDVIRNRSSAYGTPSKGSKVKQSRALHKVYHRAARAFLNRNVALTHELLDTGFKSLEGAGLNTTYLWKWDILRITFDTMLYTSPPSSSASHIPFMNEILSKPPQSFVEDMYTRSLNLFQQSENNTTAALPAHVLSTLVYSSLKVDAPDIGRRMIEDWLASRGDTTDLSSSWTSTSTSLTENSMSDGYDADGSINGDSPVDVGLGKGSDSYAKILELYCLQVLPKLGQWEYAMEFLEYESELELEPRDNLTRSLQSLYAQAIASRLPSTSSSQYSSSASLTLPASATQRAFSPAPSASSSSSSLSTTSTHTIVAATPRARASLQGISASSNGIIEENSRSDGTITPRQQTNAGPRRGQTDTSKGKQSVETPLASSSTPSGINAYPLNPNALTPLSLPKTHLNSLPHRQNLSTFALIKASIGPLINRIIGASSANKIASLCVVFVVVPVFSLLVRMFRRRARIPISSGPSAGTANVDLVRHRLQTVNNRSSVVIALGKILVKAWWEIIRVVVDTVKMGGSGLV